MKISKVLSVAIVGLSVVFGTAQAETATGLQTATELQTQTQTHERAGPMVNQPSNGAKTKLYQKQYQHQYKHEKNLTKSENGNRGSQFGTQSSGVGSKAMGSSGNGSMNRSGGGGKH